MRLIDADALMPDAEHKGRYDTVTAYDIANAPTIEERKTGKWILDDAGCLICSQCGNAAEINILSGEPMNTPWCNECGARMT